MKGPWTSKTKLPTNSKSIILDKPVKRFCPTASFIDTKIPLFSFLTCVQCCVWDRYLFLLNLESPQFHIYNIFMDIVTLQYPIKLWWQISKSQQISSCNISHAPESNHPHHLSKHIRLQCNTLTYPVAVLINKQNHNVFWITANTLNFHYSNHHCWSNELGISRAWTSCTSYQNHSSC